MKRFSTLISHVVLVMLLIPAAVVYAAELNAPVDPQPALVRIAKPSRDTLPLGHAREISVFSISRDGRYAMTGDIDQNNFLWDLKSGTLLRGIGTPEQLPIWVVSAVFSPDSSILLWVRLRKHMPVLWEVKSGKRLGVLASKENGHKAEIVSLAFSHDGRYAATGDRQGVIVFWNMKDRSVVRRIKAHQGQVNQLVFIPGKSECASVGLDGALMVWSVERNDSPAVLVKPSDELITALTVSANGSVMYAAFDDMTVKGWNVATRTLRSTLSFGDRQINGLDLSPSGDLLAVVGEDNGLTVWSIRENRTAWRNDLYEPALSAKFSQDGASLYTSGGDNWIREWQVSSGRMIRKFGGVIE